MRYNMNKKIFYRVITAVIAVCIVLTIAHFAYDVFAYRHASIIYFIAKELW